MSSDPLFPCCQSSVAGTSRFGIRSHTRRYSDLAIPSSLKSLARVHCRDLAHHLVANVGRSEYIVFPGLSSFQLVLRKRAHLPQSQFKFKIFSVGQPRNSQSHKSGHKALA